MNVESIVIPLLLCGLATCLFCWGMMIIIRRPKVPSVSTYTDTKQSVARYCTRPSCRAPISPHHKFCGRCGTPTKEMTDQQIWMQMQMTQMPSDHPALLMQQQDMRGQTTELTGGYGYGLGQNQYSFNYSYPGGRGLL